MTQNEILNPELGNPDFDLLYAEDTYRKGQKLQDKYLDSLYDSIQIETPSAGSVVRSTYLGMMSNQYVFSVVGYKDDVRIENKPGEAKYLNSIEVGEQVDLLITEVVQSTYYIKGSIASLYESRAHENMKSLEEGESVTAYIRALNPAGYDVELTNGGVTLPAFMPNTLAGINKLYDPSSIIGDTFQVMVESFSEHEGTYIVSRRKYLQSLIPDEISNLEFNTLYGGRVTGTTPFGIFVEFNECLTGMIHKANVTEEWQNRISEIKPGQQIEFYIKEIIKDKIILTQVLRETLWDTIKNGQLIEGRVKDVKQFGTLVILDDETVGLIHTSEMEKLGKKFTSGQDIRVKVLSVDRSSRKIFLTLG
jgi:small subunit ribosomal protein S1